MCAHMCRMCWEVYVRGESAWEIFYLEKVTRRQQSKVTDDERCMRFHI